MRQRPFSVRTRIALLFLLADTALIVAFAISVFLHMQYRMQRSFDDSLRANAEALATLIEVEDEGATIELDFTDDRTQRFTRHKRPDLFTVMDIEGQLLDVPHSWKELPAWAKSGTEEDPRDFDFDGESYRGLVFLTPSVDSSGEHRIPLMIFFGASRHGMDDELEDTLAFLLIAGGGILLLSILAAFAIARAGLRPVGALAEQAGAIDDQSLNRRFNAGAMPADLEPFANAFNELLARIEKAFEREKRFSADAAHELRTPVSTLKSGIQAALLSPIDAATDRETLHGLLDDVIRLEELCEALLLAGMPSEGSRTPTGISSAQLRGEIEAIVESFASRAESTRSQIVLEAVAPADAVLRTDGVTVRRIVGNLIDNALRHGGESVRVRVGLSDRLGIAAAVIVEDNGRGISPELRPHLFQRFARGDASRSRLSGGAGLGLAICRALAEAQGGKLELLDGPGTRFQWTIALAGT